MEKAKLHTPDFTESNIAKLAELFPSCVVEAKDEKTGELRRSIDFDQLRQELSGSIVEGPQERYRLDWPGKREALVAANAPIAKTLRPDRDESVDFDTTKNLFIEGDNLDALKLLQETYLGKVKMIYIDPPYNTGKDFIYRDDFSVDQQEHEVASGEKDGAAQRLVTNPEGHGRFHSKWLTMMEARLRRARPLLTEDGAIFVSCDEGEQPRLRLIMDEIFGQDNFVADMVWAAGRKNDSRLISISHKYIVCYARNTEHLKESKIIWRQRKKGLDEIYAQYKRLKREHGTDFETMTNALKDWYKNLADGQAAKAHKHYTNIDKKGVYFAADISWPGGGGPKYEVLHPTTGKPVKTPARGWMTPDKAKMQRWILEDKVHFGADERSVPCIKKYLHDSEHQTPYSVFYQDGRAASKRLRALMDGDLFDFPKDELVLQELIEMLTSENDLIVDFFAGSSTTAHSVLLQNSLDGANRKFIMVQLDESTPNESSANKAGYKSITEVSRERIKRAGAQIVQNEYHPEWRRDVGFRMLRVDTSNVKDIFYTPDQVKQDELDLHVDHIKEDRNGEDLLFQIMLDWGVDLSLPIASEKIRGKEVFFVDENAIVACFETGINEDLVKELAKRQPLRAVFRDSGFADDSVKINIGEIFKLLSPATELKTI